MDCDSPVRPPPGPNPCEETVAVWSDPELDGDPVIEPLVLQDASGGGDHVPRLYALESEAWNDRVEPPEDVGAQIDALAEEHWFFFTGSAVASTATGPDDEALLAQRYLDADGQGLPVGLEAAVQRPAWLQELEGTHTPETEQYGIGSIVYRARHPFHPGRLRAWLDAAWPGVVRAKGWFWVACRPKLTAEFQLSGNTWESNIMGMWFAAIPLEQRDLDPELEAELTALWHPQYGDRRQETVLIGIDIDEAALRAGFDAALMTEEERRDPTRWGALEHSFPWSELSLFDEDEEDDPPGDPSTGPSPASTGAA